MCQVIEEKLQNIQDSCSEKSLLNVFHKLSLLFIIRSMLYFQGNLPFNILLEYSDFTRPKDFIVTCRDKQIITAMKFFVHVLSTYLKYTGNIKFYKEWYNMYNILYH